MGVATELFRPRSKAVAQKARRECLKAAGICCVCGAARALSERTMCEICLRKSNASKTRSSRSCSESERAKHRKPEYSLADVIRLANENNISYGEMSARLEGRK